MPIGPTEPVQSNNPPGQPRVNVRKLLLPLIAMLLLVALVVIIAVKKDSTQPNNQPSTTGVVPEESDGEQRTITVAITRDGFVPATVTIPKGTKVIWTNNDDKPHLVASDPHPVHDGLEGLNTKTDIAPNASYSFTFDQVGEYTYHDHLNPNMNGVVIVE